MAFLSLRRYANLILNLFSLMVDASVPDIALEPDKTVRKVQVIVFFFFFNLSGLLLKGILIITISEIRMTNKKNMLANFQPYKLNFSIPFNLN